MNDQPTPQHDDETALVHAVMNTLDGALHHDIDYRDVKAILDALKTLGYELVVAPMTTEFPSLAEVAATHRWASRYTVTRFIAGCTSGWEKDITNTAKSGVQLQGEHVEKVWLEARTIKTIAQRDNLPIGSIVVDRLGDICQKDNIFRWACDGDDYVPDLVELPALLIHHPDWRVE